MPTMPQQRTMHLPTAFPLRGALACWCLQCANTSGLAWLTKDAVGYLGGRCHLLELLALWAAQGAICAVLKRPA